jgi:endonuclease/exonuclease/phosphatase family metal-dependent hydrolase
MPVGWWMGRMRLRQTWRTGFFATMLVVMSSLSMEIHGANAEPFRTATFNIKYIVDPAGLPKWEARRDAVTAVLKAMDADIIGFQEMETFAGGKFNRISRHLDWIMQTVLGYKAAAIGDPTNFPSTQPILYRPERFELLDQGWFYYSTTPDVIYSRSFDGGFDYYASTARFQEKASGKPLLVFNVHTDIRSSGNRRGAIRMIADRVLDAIARGENVIVLGDFNAGRFTQNMRLLKETGLEGTDLLRPTFHLGLGLGIPPAIDHILHSNGITRVGEAQVHKDKANGSYPSDHYPVSALYEFKEK